MEYMKQYQIKSISIKIKKDLANSNGNNPSLNHPLLLFSVSTGVY